MEDGGYLERTRAPFFMGTALTTCLLGGNIGLLLKLEQNSKSQSLVHHTSLAILTLVAIVYTIICQYAVWAWYLGGTTLDLNLLLWPYATCPILSGVLICGVQILLTYRAYVLSERKFRIIPVFLICLSFAQTVFSFCRTMEILGIQDFKKTYSTLYIYPFWMAFVVITNLIITMFTYYILIGMRLRFDVSKNWFIRIIVLAPQTHLLTSLLGTFNLTLFVLRRDSTYLTTDLCMGNLHLLSLLIIMNLKPIRSTTKIGKEISEHRKSQTMTVTDLTIEIPMSPLSTRISRNRLSSEWTATFIDGIESNRKRLIELDQTIKGSSSSSSHLKTRSIDNQSYPHVK